MRKKPQKGNAELVSQEVPASTTESDLSAKEITDDFFADLDRAHSRGWCSANIILWLTVLFIIVGIMVIWIYVEPANGSSPHNAFHIGSINISTPSFLRSKKTNQSTQEYTVHLSSSELTSALGTISLPNLSSPVSEIHPNAIQIRAEIQSPLKAPCILSVIPRVENGTIRIEVDDLTVSGVRALPLATVGVRNALNQALQTSIESKFSGTITRIVLEEGRLTAYLVPKS